MCLLSFPPPTLTHRRLMQPGMEAHPDARAMLVDYLHLTDAAGRQAGAEVLLVMRRLLDTCASRLGVGLGLWAVLGVSGVS